MFALGRFAVAALLAASASGHMEMKTPVPYGKSSLDNSPLLADGSNFPCKQRPGVYDLEGASNVMAIGEPQTLSFIGSAVHGGGSCQVSLTTDLQPTKDSKWMVIKSIEGGCPASVPGNLPADPNGSGASTFQYTIPEGIAPGQYTIAWSWLNKIGNREFYMNCGPATVTAPKKKRYNPNPVVRRQSSFPAMYVANLAGINTCTTTEGDDYTYPNPGADVQKAGTGPYVALDAACAGGSDSTPAQQPSSSGNDTAATGVAPTGTATGAGFGGSTPSASSASAGVFASGAASAEPSVPVASSTTPSQAPASTGISSSSGSGTGSISSSSGSQTAGAPCTDEGAWACSADGSAFQRCASGTWSVPMSMPAGMSASCSGPNGFSMTAKTGGGKMKRVVRRSEGLFEPYD